MPKNAKWLKFASAAFTIIIPLMGFWLISIDFLYWGQGIERLNSNILGQNFYVIYDAPPIPERQIFGGLAAVPVLALRLISYWHLWKMFKNFTQQKIMVSETVYRLKQYAKYASLGVVAFFFLSGVRRWSIGEFSDLPLWTHLQFTPHETVILFTSAIIYIASAVIEEGNRYKFETESYV